MNTVKILNLTLLLTLFSLISCQNDSGNTAQAPTEFKNKGHELVYKSTQKAGNFEKLSALKDVIYTYTYTTSDNKQDITTEKYIFDGEMSYAMYKKHERTLPDLEGAVEQGFDGTTFWLKNNGKYIDDEAAMKRVAFNRKTNFYWFAMLQKLLDPGLNYKHIKEQTVKGKTYDVVDVSFNSDKPTDIYRVYINQKTDLIDQFIFTVADFNIMDEPFLMEVQYEETDGILIPTKRRYTKADWDGNVVDQDKWTSVQWTDIQFNNGLAEELFKVEG